MKLKMWIAPTIFQFIAQVHWCLLLLMPIIKPHHAMFAHDIFMFWHLHQVSKIWFRLIGENVFLNALGIDWVDHRLYLSTIAINDISKQFFQKYLEFEVFGWNKNACKWHTHWSRFRHRIIWAFQLGIKKSLGRII